MQKIKRQIQLQLNVRERVFVCEWWCGCLRERERERESACVSVLKPEHDVAIFSLRNIFLVVMSS